MKPKKPRANSGTSASSEIVLYQTEDGRTRVECRFENENVWLTQKLMGELFQKDVRTINEHIQNVFAEGELQPESVIRNFRITAADGKSYETMHYSLDVIISVGYRVKSTLPAPTRGAGSVLPRRGLSMGESLTPAKICKAYWLLQKTRTKSPRIKDSQPTERNPSPTHTENRCNCRECWA
jgi:hypothetical protein